MNTLHMNTNIKSTLAYKQTHQHKQLSHYLSPQQSRTDHTTTEVRVRAGLELESGRVRHTRTYGAVRMHAPAHLSARMS